jgi:hypothetical protein
MSTSGRNGRNQDSHRPQSNQRPANAKELFAVPVCSSAFTRPAALPHCRRTEHQTPSASMYCHLLSVFRQTTTPSLRNPTWTWFTAAGKSPRAMASTESPLPTTRHPIQLVVINEEFNLPAPGCALVPTIHIKLKIASTVNNPAPFRNLVLILGTTRHPALS